MLDFQIFFWEFPKNSYQGINFEEQGGFAGFQGSKDRYQGFRDKEAPNFRRSQAVGNIVAIPVLDGLQFIRVWV